MQPSEFDLETLATMDELTDFSLSFNPKLKTNIVLNQCPTHSKITVKDDAIELVKAFENLHIAKTQLGHRVAFSYSISRHQSVIEFENEKKNSLPAYQAKSYSQKASEEIMSLYKEITGHDFIIKTAKQSEDCLV
jgi:chromosome partitioning protein